MTRIFTLGLALLFFAGCDPAESEETIRVGVLLSLSGTLGDVGGEMLSGMEFAVDEFNSSDLLPGASIELVQRDDESDPSKTQTQFLALVDGEGAMAVLGPHTSTATRLIVSAATDKQVPTLSPTSAAVGLGEASDYLFRSSLTVERLVPAGIEISKRNLGYTRAAVIVNTSDAFSSSNNRTVVGALARHTDVTVVSTIEYERPQTDAIVPDLATELSELKAAEPDAVFISGLPADRIGVMLQLHAAGITGVPTLTSLLSNSDIAQVIQQNPAAAEGAVAFHVWMASSAQPLSRDFVANYRAASGKEPSDYVARGYAAAFVLARAIADSENHESSAVQQALAKTRGLDTIFGSFAFDEHGDAMYDPVVAQVRNGSFVTLQ